MIRHAVYFYTDFCNLSTLRETNLLIIIESIPNQDAP